MSEFFEKRDPWGNGMALWVLVAMAFITPVAWSFVKEVKLENEVQNWLPADDPQAAALNWYHEEFASEDRVLLSWKGSTLDDPRIDMLVEKLEGASDAEGERHGGSPYIRGIATPQEVLQRMEENDVDPEEALRRLDGILIGRGALKVKLTEAGKQVEDRAKRLLIKQAREQMEQEIRISDAQPQFPDFDFLEDEEFDVEIPDDQLPPERPTRDDSFFDASKYVTWKPHDFQISWPQMNVQPALVKQLSKIAKDIRGRPSEQIPEGKPLFEEIFQVPGSPIAFSVGLTEAGMEDRNATFKAIREAATSVGIPDEDLHMGGRPYAGEELNKELVSVGWNESYPLSQFHRRSPFLLSAIVGIVLSFVMLRSVRLATLVIIVALYTMFVAVAVVPATHGSMNMVLVVMPTLLMVLTISAAIHVCNYWKHAAIVDMKTAVVEAVKMARQPCVLASITTAIGLVSLRTSPLKPVSDFGMYSAVGCLVSMIVVLFCLPALLLYWRGKTPKSAEVDRETWRSFGHTLARHRWAVSVGCLMLFAGCTYGLKYFRTEIKVIRYFPENTRVVQDYNFLEDNLAGIIPVETIIRFNEEEQRATTLLERMKLVRDVQEKMRAHPDISGTISMADFHNFDRYEKNDDGTDRSTFQINLASRRLESLLKGDKAKEVKSMFAIASKDITLYPGQGQLELPVTKGDELWRITAQVAIMSDLDYEELTGPPGDLTKEEKQARQVAAKRKKATELASEFSKEGEQNGDFIPPDGEAWPDDGLEDLGDWSDEKDVAESKTPAASQDSETAQDKIANLPPSRNLNKMAASVLSLYPGAGHIVTGMVPLFLRTQQAVLESLITSFALAFGIIAVVMMILLRNPLAGAMTMIPNLLPVGVVFGLVAWNDIAVDIGTMITASVALGIAVDGTLHLMTWFRSGLRQGMSREDAVAEALSHCGPAMWQTSAAVGIGLAMLAFADLLLISRFGWMMGALIGAALLADIIFLPALLAGPLGALIERSTPKLTEESSDAKEITATGELQTDGSIAAATVKSSSEVEEGNAPRPHLSQETGSERSFRFDGN